MPVDEDFSLDNPDGLTEEDLRKLNEDADNLEKIATNAEANAKKIEDAKKSLEGLNFAQLNLLNKTIGEEGTETQSPVGVMNKEQLMDLVIEMLKTIEKQKEEQREIKKKLTEEEQKHKELEKEINNLKNNISKGADDILGFASSPISFGKSKIMGFIGRAGIYGAIASFVINFAQSTFDQVLDEVRKIYGEGGFLDVRKKIMDEMKQVVGLRQFVDVSQGRTFFTNDSGDVLRQGGAQISNIRNRVNGHKQYLQEFDS